MKPGSDYCQINSTLWKFFYNKYGGGPEIILRGNPNDETVRTFNSSNKEREERNSVNESCSDLQNTNTNGYKEINVATTTTSTHLPVQSNTSAQIQPSDQMNGNSAIDIDKANKTQSNQAAAKPTNINEKTNGKDIVHPANPTSATTTTSTIPSSIAILTAKKIPKNVSFEDNDSNSSDREGSNSIPLLDHFYIRRGKHHYSTSPTASNEIINKKDRRLRSSIKTNGFFGVEGEKTIKINIFLKLKCFFFSPFH